MLILDLITICTNNISLNKVDISNTKKKPKTQHGDSSTVGITGFSYKHSQKQLRIILFPCNLSSKTFINIKSV